MTENRYSRRVKKLVLFIMAAALLGALSLGAVVAQDATDILVWSLGYGGDYNDTLVERFNEANDDVRLPMKMS